MSRPAQSSRLTPYSAPPEPVGLWPAVLALAAGVALCLAAAIALVSGRTLSPFTWYLTRAAGISLYLLYWLVVVLGLGLTTPLLARLDGRAVLYSVHRYATELAYGFLALHMISLAIDHHVRFSPTSLLVPFVAPSNEPWTGLGVIAGYVMVLIGISFGLRRWIGQRGWRLLHFLAFPAYAMGLAHGIGAGSDTGALWMQAIYAVTGGSVFWLTAYRVLRGPARSRPAWASRLQARHRAAVVDAETRAIIR